MKGRLPVRPRVRLVSRGQTLYSRRALSIRDDKRPREKGLEQFTVSTGTDASEVSIGSQGQVLWLRITCAIIMVIKVMDFTTAIKEVTGLMGLNPLKPKQIESLQTFVSGKDTFVALPTGYGKSVIFAVLPLLFDRLLGR